MIRSAIGAAMLLAIATSPLAAQGKSAAAKGKGKAAAQAKGKSMEKGKMDHDMSHMNGPWKEMNAFHAALAPAYHAAAEANNLKPLKQKAADLAATARTWAASTPPRSCNSDVIRTTVGQISSDALALSNMTLNLAADAELKKGIVALHDKFEGVEKQCGAPAKGQEMKHEGMDHSTMPGMKRDSMPGMKHDTKGMNHDSMPGMKHDMKGMKHDSMPGMKHDMKGMKHDSMPGMKHDMKEMKGATKKGAKRDSTPKGR